jgi:hypothetical protein
MAERPRVERNDALFWIISTEAASAQDSTKFNRVCAHFGSGRLSLVFVTKRTLIRISTLANRTAVSNKNEFKLSPGGRAGCAAAANP